MTGRGRPPVGPPIHVRLPADMLGQVDELAERWGQSRAAAVRSLVALGLVAIALDPPATEETT